MLPCFSRQRPASELAGKLNPRGTGILACAFLDWSKICRDASFSESMKYLLVIRIVGLRFVPLLQFPIRARLSGLRGTEWSPDWKGKMRRL